MSSPYAIQAERLGKCFRLGHREPYLTFRDALHRLASAPFRALGQHRPPASESIFWSLQDVSFDVRMGEVLSIIGANGSGKSTLLKILAGITEPTRGHADLNGSTAALLEIGTGFHSELTGRENIYLNGAILGMRKTEIDRNFNEIVDFAEIGKYIEEPIKYYSNGMFLRLGFSVAAHLEPSILLVDEVLSVGDLAFQRKCHEKIRQITAKGVTVVFVSHDLHAVRELSHRTMLLSHGRVIEEGDPGTVIARYADLASRQ